MLLLPDKPHRHLFLQGLHLEDLHSTGTGSLWLRFSATKSCPALSLPRDCSTPGFPVLIYLLSLLMSIESLMPSNHLILCDPLLLLPSVFPSIRVFPKESALHIRWPNVGASASAYVLPMNIQGRFPLGWTGWISLLSKGLSRVFLSSTVQKHQFFSWFPAKQQEEQEAKLRKKCRSFLLPLLSIL